MSPPGSNVRSGAETRFRNQEPKPGFKTGYQDQASRPGIRPGIKADHAIETTPDLRGDADGLIHIADGTRVDQLVMQPGRTAVAALAEAAPLQAPDQRAVPGD